MFCKISEKNLNLFENNVSFDTRASVSMSDLPRSWQQNEEIKGKKFAIALSVDLESGTELGAKRPLFSEKGQIVREEIEDSLSLNRWFLAAFFLKWK